jgi:hypothetical protein
MENHNHVHSFVALGLLTGIGDCTTDKLDSVIHDTRLKHKSTRIELLYIHPSDIIICSSGLFIIYKSYTKQDRVSIIITVHFIGCIHNDETSP